MTAELGERHELLAGFKMLATSRCERAGFARARIASPFSFGSADGCHGSTLNVEVAIMLAELRVC